MARENGRRTNMEKVSVIVPVLNAGEYLQTCIESIMKQKYGVFEILLIDNGSTDGSREICERYAKEHENIRVLYQQEKGVSAARNMGIEEAQGEYLVFVDADDYVLGEEALELMAGSLEQSGADIAVGHYIRLWNGKMFPADSHGSIQMADRDSSKFWFEGFFSGGVLSYVWCKMYRLSFLKKHMIRFGGYNYAEDKMFNFICYVCGAKYSFVEKFIYVYRKNDDSVSNTYREDSCVCWMRIAKDLQSLLNKRSLEEEYSGLVASTIFFAVFFDAKMRYLYEGRKTSAVKSVLAEYRSYPLAKRYIEEYAVGGRAKEIPSFLWRTLIWGFSVNMYREWDGILAFGIKLLVNMGIDEMLSDTGRRG